MFFGGRRRALAGLSLVVAVALAGCSGGGSKPVSLPSIQPSSPSASLLPSADPSASAVAVIRAYYALINGLHAHMDANALGALMSKDCSCQQQVRAVAAAAAKGERFVDRAHLVSLTPAVNSSTSVDVLVQYNAAAGGLVDARGHHLTSTSARKGLKRLFHVRRIGSSWLIVEIDEA